MRNARLCLNLFLLAGIAGVFRSGALATTDTWLRQNTKPAVKSSKSKQECDPKEMWESSNGYQQFTCSPEGKVVEDKGAEASLAKAESHRQELAIALRTRILLPAEMAEVLSYGPNLFVQNMQPYFQDTIDKEFNEALEIQRQLRTMNDAPKVYAQNQIYRDTGINHGPDNCLSKSGAIVLCNPVTTPRIPCPNIHTGNDGQCHPDMISLINAVPFDVPPKEWDGPGTHAANPCGPPDANGTGICNGMYIPELDHHIACTDKKRVLLTDEAGKRHCYGFFLLGVSNPR